MFWIFILTYFLSIIKISYPVEDFDLRDALTPRPGESEEERRLAAKPPYVYAQSTGDFCLEDFYRPSDELLWEAEEDRRKWEEKNGRCYNPRHTTTTTSTPSPPSSPHHHHHHHHHHGGGSPGLLPSTMGEGGYPSKSGSGGIAPPPARPGSMGGGGYSQGGFGGYGPPPAPPRHLPGDRIRFYPPPPSPGDRIRFYPPPPSPFPRRLPDGPGRHTPSPFSSPYCRPTPGRNSPFSSPFSYPGTVPRPHFGPSYINGPGFGGSGRRYNHAVGGPWSPWRPPASPGSLLYLRPGTHDVGPRSPPRSLQNSQAPCDPSGPPKLRSELRMWIPDYRPKKSS